MEEHYLGYFNLLPGLIKALPCVQEYLSVDDEAFFGLFFVSPVIGAMDQTWHVLYQKKLWLNQRNIYLTYQSDPQAIVEGPQQHQELPEKVCLGLPNQQQALSD